MAELILGPMLRHVDETSATIWVETDASCTVEILGRRVRTFCVGRHHYALAIIEGLQPGTCTVYDVRLDGEVRWPAEGSVLPASTIRTLGGDGRVRIVFGSCRTAAPHVAPWTLDLTLDPRGRGVDALYAYALGMLEQTIDVWPDLAVFLGDQIYADDSSPRTHERIAEKRKQAPNTVESALPPELVDGFEEFTWLYHESWSPEIERWFFSNVPTAMIFDDHEMIDDWNISAAWVDDIRREDWWEDHVVGGLMTYWLYQHLGNLSPAVIRSEGLLDELRRVDDGEQRLREWAMHADEFTQLSGGYPFHFHRDLGRVRLVMMDARNRRVLTPGKRQIIDDSQWQWLVDACAADIDHLLIGSSLPIFVPGGLHDLQVWNEAICDGAWAKPGRRLGEWARRRADMEDWPAFNTSFTAFVELLEDLGGTHRQNPPATISVLSGDIHFSYASELIFPDAHPMASRAHQLVNSPIRNALKPPESTAMRLGTSRFGSIIGKLLRHSVRRKKASVSWRIDRGPLFANSIGEINFNRRSAQLTVKQTLPHDERTTPELNTAIDVDLVTGSRTPPHNDPPTPVPVKRRHGGWRNNFLRHPQRTRAGGGINRSAP